MDRKLTPKLILAGTTLIALIFALVPGGAPRWYDYRRLGHARLEGQPEVQVTGLAIMPLSSREYADGKARWRNTYSGDVRLAIHRNGRSEWRQAWTVSVSGTNRGKDVTVRLEH